MVTGLGVSLEIGLAEDGDEMVAEVVDETGVNGRCLESAVGKFGHEVLGGEGTRQVQEGFPDTSPNR